MSSPQDPEVGRDFSEEVKESVHQDDGQQTPKEEEDGEEESVKLDIKLDDEGDDTATLPLKKKKEEEKKKPPVYIFPVLRLKRAWSKSSNTLDFVLRVIAIVFSTFGWLCCVGGIPLMSIVMVIIGSIYIKDCKIQPNIPVYLVVSGVFGTIQHFVAVWARYIPKESSHLRTYRAYCKVIDYTLELFLIIWFVLGCIWVYGVPEEIDFRDDFKDEYCNKTVYYFAFWMLNLSFILLLLLVVVTLFAIICIVVSPTKEELK